MRLQDYLRQNNVNLEEFKQELSVSYDTVLAHQREQISQMPIQMQVYIRNQLTHPNRTEFEQALRWLDDNINAETDVVNQKFGDAIFGHRQHDICAQVCMHVRINVQGRQLTEADTLRFAATARLAHARGHIQTAEAALRNAVLDGSDTLYDMLPKKEDGSPDIRPVIEFGIQTWVNQGMPEGKKLTRTADLILLLIDAEEKKEHSILATTTPGQLNQGKSMEDKADNARDGHYGDILEIWIRRAKEKMQEQAPASALTQGMARLGTSVIGENSSRQPGPP